MKITRSPQSHTNAAGLKETATPSSTLGRLWPVAVAAILVASMIAVNTLFPAGLRSAIYSVAQEHGFRALDENIRFRSAIAQLPTRLAANIFDRPHLPTLTIDINFRNLSKLLAKRQNALDIGYLVQGEDDYVPASIRIGGQTVGVKVRLKGDMLDHLRTDKWSLRVQTKGDEQLFGLRRFSLQHPVTRGYQYEVMFLETLRRTGVLAPKYFFVEVVINGNNIGVMALEEHFSKELLERNSRREGVIVRFDESLMWADRVARGQSAVLTQGPFDNYHNAPISAFQTAKITQSKSLSDQYAIATGLLRGFADGEIAASEAFDAELLGRYLATAEFWGAWHATDWNNQRFYLNPLTVKLEPIGYDAHLQDKIRSGSSIYGPGSLAHRMLDDPQVFTAYDRALMQLKDELLNGDLFNELAAVQESALRELRTEFIFLQSIDLDDLRARVQKLPYPRREHETVGPFGAHVIAYTVDEGDRSYLELSNPLPHPVEISSIKWAGPDGAAAAFEPLAEIEYPLALLPAEAGGGAEPVVIDYSPIQGAQGLWLNIESNVQNQSDTVISKSQVGFPKLSKNPLPAADLESLLARNPFLSVSDDNKEILVAKGRWDVDGSIVVPQSHGLRISGGTTLRFGAGTGLVAYGYTLFEGSSNEPIVLEGPPEGTSGQWQGIIVHGAADRSYWNHVHVHDTAGVRWSTWELTGGTTFYKSNLTMSDCTFSGSKAEDALNIIHSEFELNNVNFLNSESDALDSDFSRGTIRNVNLEDIGLSHGADGLDFSGSDVTIENARFVRVSDKAISVGERSNVRATGIVAEYCGIGAVSKDDSQLEIYDSTISSAVTAGLMSYVKKPEYGAATLIANNVMIRDTSRTVAVQHGSRLSLNGDEVESQNLNIDALYPPEMEAEPLR